MDKTAIRFTPEIATLSDVTNKTIERVIKQSIGIGHTDYCILQQLLIYGTNVKIAALREFLLLKPNSVTSAIDRLHKKGFVAKESCPDDLRTFTVRITDEGRKAAHKSSLAIREDLGALTWEDPDDMRINWGMAVHASLFYRDKSSFTPQTDDENFLNIDLEDESFVIPAWVINVKLVQQLWNTQLMKRFQLSMSEYRILAHIARASEPVHSSDIAHRLFLEKSVVSQFLKKLKEKHLVAFDADERDKRSFGISLTTQGAEIEKAATDLLETLTAQHFEALSPELIDKQNQWHLDMYKALTR